MYNKIKYNNFPAGKAAAMLIKVVTSHRLYRIIQASIINTTQNINKSRKCTFSQY